MPASLAGTSVPGGWDKTDANGSLVPTPQLRQLFEYYLAALGEETLPQLVARIEQALARLEEPARSEALDTLGDYLDYKLALGDLEATYGHDATTNAEDMQRRMAEIRALRRTWMDAQTADAFFATDEAVDQFQVEQLRIRTDPSLSEKEREQALAEARRHSRNRFVRHAGKPANSPTTSVRSRNSRMIPTPCAPGGRNALVPRLPVSWRRWKPNKRYGKPSGRPIARTWRSLTTWGLPAGAQSRH